MLIVDSDTVAGADFDTVAAAGADFGTLGFVDSGTVSGCCYLFVGTCNCYHPYAYGKLQKNDVLTLFQLPEYGGSGPCG